MTTSTAPLRGSESTAVHQLHGTVCAACGGRAAGDSAIGCVPTSASSAASGTSRTPRRRRRRAELLEAAGQLVLWDWRPPPRALPEHARETGYLGDALLRLRLDMRWTLPELADAAAMGWRRVSRIERGGLPTMAEVARLASALAVDADDLGDLRAGRTDARSRPAMRAGARPAVRPGVRGAASWDALAWADDPHAQAAVVRGVELTTEEIAAITGWSHRTVQRALEGALAKLRAG